jgi:hypothetical protein
MQKIKFNLLAFFLIIVAFGWKCPAMLQAQRKVLLASGLRSIAANALIKELPKPDFGKNGAWEQTTKLIATFNALEIIPEVQLLLFKYWYLNYGREGFRPDFDYTFSRHGLYICFSIAELNAFGKISSSLVRELLDLRYYRINDLEGLAEVPNAMHIKHLALIGSPISLSSGHVFNALCQLEHLDLRDTGLEVLPRGIFDKLNRLRVLDLRNNQIDCESLHYLDSLRLARPDLLIWLGFCEYN